MQTGAVWVVAALLGASIAAQQPKPQFEVASVKPQGESISGGSLGHAVSSAANAMPRARPGGLFNPTHASVEHLVMFAYDLRPYRIVGGPDWMRRDLFQINARAESDAPAGQIRLMVQSLLEDRFKLVTHVEPREMRFQALVRARPDGPLGPSLFTIDECTTAIVNELGVQNKLFLSLRGIPGGGGPNAPRPTPEAEKAHFEALFSSLNVPKIDLVVGFPESDPT